MRAVMNAQCFLVFALYVAQIMQMYGDRRVDDVKHGGYEIFKVDEYVSLVEKQDRSDGKGKFHFILGSYNTQRGQSDVDQTQRSKTYHSDKSTLS
jgi:hypothetical protein